MNKLPSSTSFQGVLDSIIRNYLLNELPPEGAENGNTRHHVAEKDLGSLQGSGLNNPHGSASTTNLQNESEVNNNNTVWQLPGTSRANTFTSANPTDQEYIKAVYQCFEKRGVFKELQTFLRHKLVSILQDEWPNLQKPVSARQREGPNTIVYRLVDDFLRCHKLLYTLSVLASESEVKPHSTRVLYGKLSSKEAEDLLDEMGIKHNSRLSGQIIKCYFDNDNFSLLESMHYLGIWLDDSSVQLDDLQQENGGTKHGKRRGSGGESVLRRGKEKVVEAASVSESKKEKRESENVTGVEQRLLDLEKNLEREKDIKIKEAIEKYKNDEQVKLRQELETNFKLQLIEKEREHFLDMQKRMDEIKTEMNQERQKWLEVKLRQETELSDFRKQLSEMMNASGDSNWRNVAKPPINGNGSSSHYKSTSTKTAAKMSQVTFDDTSEHKFSCRNRSPLWSPNLAQPISSNQQPAIGQIDQDRLVFLQYRMEQQDEEIKTLRRQLQVSLSPMPSTKSRATRERVTSNVPAENNERKREQPGRGGNTNKSDDLTKFLSESRARVEKLDDAVEQVDEIVQLLISKRRPPLSNEISTRLLSAAIQKNSNKSLSQLYSSLHNMSTASVPVLSPMNFPSTVPLVHQQVPERQRALAPSTIQNSSPSFNQTTAYPHYSGLLNMPRNHYPSPPPSISLATRSAITTIKSPPKVNEIFNRPETPVDRIFDVAYGPPQPVKTQKQSQKEREETSKQLLPETPIPIQMDSNNDVVREMHSEEIEHEESLFHMAIRNDNVENKMSSNGSESARKKKLEETAIRNGALSREKILSSDEGDNENSISISLSISGSLNQKVRRPILKPAFNNGASSKDSVKAISRSKVPSESFDKLDEVHKRTATGNGETKDARRPSIFTPPLSAKSKDNSVASSSSSSSRKKSSPKVRAQNGSGSHRYQGDDNDDDDQSSLNISVPKSVDGEDNAEDFWQL